MTLKFCCGRKIKICRKFRWFSSVIFLKVCRKSNQTLEKSEDPDCFVLMKGVYVTFEKDTEIENFWTNLKFRSNFYSKVCIFGKKFKTIFCQNRKRKCRDCGSSHVDSTGRLWDKKNTATQSKIFVALQEVSKRTHLKATYCPQTCLKMNEHTLFKSIDYPFRMHQREATKSRLTLKSRAALFEWSKRKNHLLRSRIELSKLLIN